MPSYSIDEMIKRSKLHMEAGQPEAAVPILLALIECLLQYNHVPIYRRYDSETQRLV